MDDIECKVHTMRAVLLESARRAKDAGDMDRYHTVAPLAGHACYGFIDVVLDTLVHAKDAPQKVETEQWRITVERLEDPESVESVEPSVEPSVSS